jgi:uncharacterized protein
VGGKQENSGLVLLIAPNERQYRIEVGYGLEGDIPDGLAGEMGRRMRPYFRQQQYSQGIRLAVNSIVATLAEKKHIQIEGTDPALAYRGQPRRERETSGLGGAGIFLLVLLIIIIVIALAASDAGRRGGPRGRRRYDRGSDWLAYPIIFGGGGSGGFGGHQGGGSSWGGGGFGGFGGGSFGGGGASGNW